MFKHGIGCFDYKMKQLRLLKYDDDYGYFDVSKVIGVNLSGLWRAADNEGQFIDYYCKIVQHEWLHEQIFESLWELYMEKEESIVEMLSSTGPISSKSCKELYQVWKV